MRPHPRLSLLTGLLLVGLSGACDRSTKGGTGQVGDDTQGDGGTTTDDADADADGFTVAGGDCDDTDPTAFPGAAEVCDDVDNNCDGAVDEGVTALFYPDADRDGYGDDDTAATEACSAPEGLVADNTDCDDTDPAFHPGADESDCTDPADYNCDGSVGYEDADADGFAACEDCDDASDAVHPEAQEVCNSLDDDCDGQIDDADDSVDPATQATWHADTDGDGYGDVASAVQACEAPSDHVEDNTDCDDTDPAFHPGADESDCTDPADYNCDGSVGFVDADSDGFAACEDCDDADAAVNPNATEVCDADDTDEDCSGYADDLDGGVASAGKTTWYADADADTYGAARYSWTSCDAPAGYVADGTDCDDVDPAIHPGATEVCDAADTDENCTGTADDADPTVDPTTQSTWYADTDADGYGSSSTSLLACDAPSGHVSDLTDCDDTDSAVNPGATEVCNGTDDNCDGTIDESTAGLTFWYADTDGDGYGDASSAVESCTQPTGHVADATDCDDSDAAVSPGGTEVCNGTDDDCDGSTDGSDAIDAIRYYADADGDGFGDPSTSVLACTAPTGFVADDTDCDDADASVYPSSLTGPVTLSYTGSVQTFTVPACSSITQLTITAYGAEGVSGSRTSSVAGKGGMAEGTLAVTGGETLYVYVGGQDGFNGGGDGWSGSSVACNGGGGSDVRLGSTALADRIIVAGGGGGTSGESSWGAGGAGGGGSCGSNYCGGGGGTGYPSSTMGGAGTTSGGSGGSSCHGGPGGGGGLSSGGGGATSSCYGGAVGGSGTLGVGGTGAASPSGCCGSYGVAGGGGGYYGGGAVAAGCCGGGGAGGGSSWTGTLSSPSFSAGVQSGDGQVVLSW